MYDELRRRLALLGRAHVLEILHHMVGQGNAPLRFGELKEYLGIAQTSLSHTLQALVQAGLLTRTETTNKPPRVHYAPTPAAVALGPTMSAFITWTEQTRSVVETPSVG